MDKANNLSLFSSLKLLQTNSIFTGVEIIVTILGIM